MKKDGNNLVRLTAAAGMLFLALISAFAPARAMTPPLPGMIEKYKADGSLADRTAFAHSTGNDLIAPELVASMQYRLANIAGIDTSRTGQKPPSAWAGLPTTGTVKVLVLCIKFTDYPNYNFIDTIKGSMFDKGKVTRFPYESLQSFYKRSSFNQLTINGNVLGWTDAGISRSSLDVSNQFLWADTREKLIHGILKTWENNGHDFAQYDNNGDGKIDYFIVIWTGPHTGWGSFWWAYAVNWNANPDLKLSGKTLGRYVWMPEDLYEPPNTASEFEPTTAIHETGHALGLPDYYDYDEDIGPDGGLGGLDMMDANWGDHNGFSKFLLDWLTPTVYNGSYTAGVQLRSTDLYPEAAIVMPEAVPGQAFGEFFLVQNRNQTGNDSRHPGRGLMIYHVDSRLDSSGTNFEYDNSYSTHKLLRIMEADGLEEIETKTGYDGYADAGDYWGVTNKIFSPTTTPNSNRYGGSDSTITISNISDPGETMTFDIGITTFSAIRAYALDATHVTVEFNQAPDPTTASNAPSYNIPTLAPLSFAEVVSNNKVKLTVPQMTDGASYNLYISSSVKSTDEHSLFQGNMPLSFTYTAGPASLCYSKDRCAVISSCKDASNMSDCSPLQLINTSSGYPAAGAGYTKTPFEGAQICILDDTGKKIGDCAPTGPDGNFALYIDTYTHPISLTPIYNIAMIIPAAQSSGTPCHVNELPAAFYNTDCGVLIQKKVALKQDSSTLQIKISPITDSTGGGAPSGNPNCDTIINLTDLNILKANFSKKVGQGAEAYADFNGDGAVNLFDFNIFKANFNKRLKQAPAPTAGLCKP